jgi:hypothetical protein
MLRVGHRTLPRRKSSRKRRSRRSVRKAAPRLMHRQRWGDTVDTCMPACCRIHPAHVTCSILILHAAVAAFLYPSCCNAAWAMQWRPSPLGTSNQDNNQHVARFGPCTQAQQEQEQKAQDEQQRRDADAQVHACHQTLAQSAFTQTTALKPNCHTQDSSSTFSSTSEAVQDDSRCG